MLHYINVTSITKVVGFLFICPITIAILQRATIRGVVFDGHICQWAIWENSLSQSLSGELYSPQFFGILLKRPTKVCVGKARIE